MDSQPPSLPTCYQCRTTQNIKLKSEYTAVCHHCYHQQIQEAQYYKSLREKDPEINQITPEIFLGNEDAATMETVLVELGISAICVCGANLETPFVSNPKYAYKIYQIDDYPDASIKHLFQDHFNWMKSILNQKRKILIHCAAGISRSASFTIAFLMRQHGKGFQHTFEFIKSKRPCIHPNSGFRVQLQEYEDQLIEKEIIKTE